MARRSPAPQTTSRPDPNPVASPAAEAIARITDVSDLFHSVGVALAAGEIEAAEALLPQEQRYPLPPELPILETSELPEAPRRESAEPPTA